MIDNGGDVLMVAVVMVVRVVVIIINKDDKNQQLPFIERLLYSRHYSALRTCIYQISCS